MRMIDEKGNSYGRLVVTGLSHRNGKVYWECKCSCGNSKVVYGDHLRSGHTKSCGCLHKERLLVQNRIHGKSKTPTFSIWATMKSRCSNPNVDSYPHYGGRGIKVCDRWNDSFVNFLNDMGEKPTGMSLDRIDNNGGYSRENCKWATMKEQSANTRRKRISQFGDEELMGEVKRRGLFLLQEQRAMGRP